MRIGEGEGEGEGGGSLAGLVGPLVVGGWKLEVGWCLGHHGWRNDDGGGGRPQFCLASIHGSGLGEFRPTWGLG